ncbi:MAG: hypothetical protein SGI87_01435 [Flavobacteriales bacterium]|nr:hypothetical protein [Flavobacteriales bacterium]
MPQRQHTIIASPQLNNQEHQGECDNETNGEKDYVSYVIGIKGIDKRWNRDKPNQEYK